MGISTKQYSVNTPSNKPVRPGPAVPNRVSLFFQNTGINNGLFRFGGSCRNDGSDIIVAPGVAFQWTFSDTCPIEDLNFFSVNGTSWAVIEGVRT